MKKNKILFILLVLIFVLLLAGAYFLYNKLSGSVENNILSEIDNSNFSDDSSAHDDSNVQNDSDIQDDSNIPNDSVSQDESSTQNDSDSQDEYNTQSDSNSHNPEVTAAPDFTVTDASGNVVQLSDFLGKPVVLNFWASWCGPCKSEMPDFESAYVEYGNDIHFLMVNLTDGYQETVELAQEFINEQGYTFPVYFDTENQNATITYGVFSIPTTYFIDAEGNFVAHAKGALDMETLQKGISMILP